VTEVRRGVYKDVWALKRGFTERDIASRVDLKRGSTEAPHPFKRVDLKEVPLQKRGSPSAFGVGVYLRAHANLQRVTRVLGEGSAGMSGI